MKLLTTNEELKFNLSRLAEQYKYISFAVAWASSNTIIFKYLKENQNRIHQAVIGTHFYQTHPDVLSEFAESATVRFILQPSGVFHPKLYLFWSEDHWEALIGSANLTAGALNNNSEAMALISDLDLDGSSFKRDAVSLIEKYWEQARTVSRDLAINYRTLWAKEQPTLRRLAGKYGSDPDLPNNSPVDSSVMSMPWVQFFERAKQEGETRITQRCELLNLAQRAFQTNDHFQEMELGLRKTIAGLPTNFSEHWGWFGSMRGAGHYHQAINQNNHHISAALDAIPMQGRVSRDQYNAYLADFFKAFPKGGHGIATASRLLALKRPDQFVCIDSRNKEELCRDFGIRESGLNHNRYWEEIIERITDSVWWNEPRPNSGLEGLVWDGRAAMLDTIFFRP